MKKEFDQHDYQSGIYIETKQCGYQKYTIIRFIIGQNYILERKENYQQTNEERNHKKWEKLTFDTPSIFM